MISNTSTGIVDNLSRFSLIELLFSVFSPW
jgi:hypothetical protein